MIGRPLLLVGLALIAGDRRTGIRQSWMRHLGSCYARPNGQLHTLSRVHLILKARNDILRRPEMPVLTTCVLCSAIMCRLLLGSCFLVFYVQCPCRAMCAPSYLVSAMCADDQVTKVSRIDVATVKTQRFPRRKSARRIQETVSEAGFVHGVSNISTSHV